MRTIVLIDSGNTRLKVAVIDAEAARMRAGGDADVVGRRSQPAHREADIRAQALDNDDTRGLNDWLAALPQAPVAALATNVAGPTREAVIEAALAEVGCPVRWIVPQAQAYGLTSRYTNPKQLGADRWVSMLGVLARRAPAAGEASPFLLASFGTATTLDTVSADGVFEGGLILPGPAMMRRSLASGTANLPLVEGEATAFPTDTLHAIASGVAAAQGGAVLRQWLAGMQRYGVSPDIYASGGGWHETESEICRLLGNAATAMGCLPPTVTMIENPVLHGLAHIAAVTNLGAS